MTAHYVTAHYVTAARLPILLLALSVGFVLASCEDATNVGESLVGTGGGDPVASEVGVIDVRPADLTRPDNLPPRALGGRVEDPLLGTVAVRGYFDLTPVTSTDFRALPVEEAELRLVPSYVYGDTTSEVTLALRDVEVEWDDNALPTDTSFQVGSVIREFTFRSSDTLVVVPLPATWIAEHDAALREPDVGAAFHGFRLDPVSGNAVVGFGHGTTFYLATSQDSILSPLGKTYPFTERETPASLPADRFRMQAAVGPVTALSFEVDAIELPPSSVNRASLTLWADTTLLSENLPPNFVRPRLELLELYGVRDDGTASLVAQTTINDDGQFVFDTPALAAAVQNTILGNAPFEHYEVRIPFPNPPLQGETVLYYQSLSSVILYRDGAAEKAPEGSIIYTPLE